MNYIVSERKTEGGFTFADVHADNGEYAGRVVYVSGSVTWRPNSALQSRVGSHIWRSLEEATAFLSSTVTP